MAPKIQWLDNDQFEDIPDGTQVRRARGAGSASSLKAADPVSHFLSDPEVGQVLEVVGRRTQRVKSEAATRAARLPEVSVNVDVDDGSDYMLIIRHPSGALTFHDGEEPKTRRSSSGSKSRNKRPKKYTIKFRAPVAMSANETVRRGLFGDFIDAVVDVVVVKVTDFIAETAIDLAEVAIWKALGRKRGLYKVIPKPGAGLELKPAGNVKPGPNGKALLFIHGTFSTTQGGFGDLTNADFFDRIESDYGDAIYGFDHFSVSIMPEQNALDLLEALPSGGITCDVVTHSRGGLVLRNLVERKDELKHGDRFNLGRAALVASPNEGTPLATPERWDDTIGWIANILDLFPPNPITSNGAMIARWITWFVKVGVRAAEGLDSMNQRGEQIGELQQPPTPPEGQYSTLVSNFEPDQQLWARALDLGVDWFFDSANDLVVPTAGGWRIDRTPGNIPSDQIGVFGLGGNIDPGSEQVSHIGFFERPETQDFLVRALKGEPQNLPPLDPGTPLPTVRRSATGGLVATRTEAAVAAAAPPVPATMPEMAQPALPLPTQSISAQPHSSVFELIVLDPDQIERLGLPAAENADEDVPVLYAAYGGARVAIPFWFKKAHIPSETGNKAVDLQLASMVKDMNKRWGRLFGYHRKVRDYLDGKPGAKPLSDEDLEKFGRILFETLFPDEVRRLLDVARAREREKLFVIFTSMIPWVFDLPWEFARDAVRGSFLATEDVHFIRNVLTPTPVEKLEEREKLRMLVAVAEPRDLIPLSSAEEDAKLRRALDELSQDGLIDVDSVEHVTAQKLHRAIATGDYDIVHFIGHGYWNRDTGDSGLVLEDRAGNSDLFGGRALREVMAGRGIRLVFLNACDTGRGRMKDGEKTVALAGVAQDLFGRGVPNVIANQFPVGDRAAVAFARAIYDFLAHGKSVAQAVREARIAANYEKGGENMDWAIPVAYARDPEDRLVRNG